MSRTLLDDVLFELGTDRYAAWAKDHKLDAAKLSAELLGDPRPTVRSPYGHLIQVAIRQALVPPPVEPPTIQQLARNVMFTAWNPEAALRCPAGWKVALSADPAYEEKVLAAAPKIRERGNPIAVWGVQTQVGATRIRELAAELAADFTIMQAETGTEYATAVAAGAKIVVGNPNAWTPTQRDDAITRGERFTTMFEVYSNMGQPWPETASSQGVPVSCEVLGVGSWRLPDGTNGPNLQLGDYQPHTPGGVWATISVYNAENMSDDSWRILPPAVR